MKNILILLMLPIVIYAFIGDVQVPKWQDLAIGARGQVLCKKKKYADARIELYDYYNTLFPKLLNTTYSNKNGLFEITGTLYKNEPIHPYVYITHQCGEGERDCSFQFYREIQWEGNLYVGKVPEHLVKLGQFQLAHHQPNQTDYCKGESWL